MEEGFPEALCWELVSVVVFGFGEFLEEGGFEVDSLRYIDNFLFLNICIFYTFL